MHQLPLSQRTNYIDILTIFNCGLHAFIPSTKNETTCDMRSLAVFFHSMLVICQEFGGNDEKLERVYFCSLCKLKPSLLNTYFCHFSCISFVNLGKIRKLFLS